MGDNFVGSNYKDNFLSELVDFVANDKFQTMFETFFIKHAMVFTNEEEHKLIYHEIYQEFHDMFDGQLELFCKQLNITHGEFMKRCRAAALEDTKANHYISILLSSVEYETFVKLMKIMRPIAEQRLKIADKKDSKSIMDDSNSPSKASSKVHNDSKITPTDSKKVEDDYYVADAKLNSLSITDSKGNNSSK